MMIQEPLKGLLRSATMYKKGRSAERYVVEKLWSLGYAAVRTPGSGRKYRRPHPDIISGNGNHYFIIEVKTIKAEAKYFSLEEIENLKTFASTFGGIPLLACRFNSSWRLFFTDDLTETKHGLKAEKGNGRLLEVVFCA
jgi:Holliday junction resolvase